MSLADQLAAKKVVPRKITFDHVHFSGRFTTSPTVVAREMGDIADDELIKLITGTEISDNKRAAAVKARLARENYGFQNGNKGGMDDSFVAWDKDFFNQRAGGTHVLSKTVTYNEPGGGTAYAAWSVLDSTQNATLCVLVIAAHQARSVEARGGLRGLPKYVRKWVADTKALRALAAELKTQHKVDAVIIACDWNINIKLLNFREGMRRRFPGYKVGYKKPTPKLGTHGKRLIDFAMFTGKLVMVGIQRILPQNAASDHRPIRYRWTLG